MMLHLRSWLKNLCKSWKGFGRDRLPRGRRPKRSVRPALEALEDRTVPAGTGTGLLGQYYSGQNFGALVASRTDPSIQFNWSGKTPAPGLSADNYSVRWTGQLEALYSEQTMIYLHSDDGVRLKINGKTVIDAWSDHAVREDRASIKLVAGQKYQIELEYHQNTGNAVVKLFWLSASQKWSAIPSSQLYAAGAPASPPAPPPPPAPGSSLAASLSAVDVSAAGGTTHTFTVTYGGGSGLNLTTVGGDIRVAGPNGFSQSAAYAGVAGSGPAGVAIRYRIAAPGGSWDAADAGTYSVSLLANQIKDNSGAALPAGPLGTFGVNLGVADWFSDQLTDPALTALARTLAADHTLSRADFLNIFQTVEAGGVSAAEFADLKTLVANPTYLGMPGYVRNLAHKVVNGDPANTKFQGGTLGNLHAGSSAQQLDQLVGKWFLGLDHPQFAATGVSYVLAAGTLFGSGPAYNDAVQGLVSDCYYVAALSGIAYRSPQSIRDAFIDNGDGSYTVRFFHNGTADYVTVDKYLPVKGDGTFNFAGRGKLASDPNSKLWVGLFEKAYAQLAESGWSRPGTSLNSYESIRGGWEGEAVSRVIGKTASHGDVFNSPQTLNAIVSQVQAGRMVWLDSKNTTAPGIVQNHVYVVTGYNAATQTFSTWNVWGYGQQLTWSQVAANFDSYSFVI
jgi:hypothetical protein